MRAIVCTNFDSPLALQDRPAPPMGDDDVLIEVAACGVNFVDGLIVTGRYQITPKLPYIPGFEVAGRISAVGRNVVEFEVGQAVFATCGLVGGGYAELAVVDRHDVFPLPEGMTASQAATFVQSYCTALFALSYRADLKPGQSLLVLGASGGVGRAAVDVGKALGARVIAAASSAEKLAACQVLEPQATINYSKQDLKSAARELSGGGVDIAFDPLGGEYSEATLRSLGIDGKLLVIGFAAGQIPRLPTNQVLLNNRMIIGVDWGAWRSQHPGLQSQLMGELMSLYDSGQLHLLEPTEYPLESAAIALADVNQRRATGKVVLTP